MKKLLLAWLVIITMSCRSPVMVYDEETGKRMTEAEYKELHEEKVDVLIIIQ